jgi:hypothetical protein
MYDQFLAKTDYPPNLNPKHRIPRLEPLAAKAVS